MTNRASYKCFFQSLIYQSRRIKMSFPPPGPVESIGLIHWTSASPAGGSEYPVGVTVDHMLRRSPLSTDAQWQLAVGPSRNATLQTHRAALSDPRYYGCLRLALHNCLCLSIPPSLFFSVVTQSTSCPFNLHIPAVPSRSCRSVTAIRGHSCIVRAHSQYISTFHTILSL